MACQMKLNLWLSLSASQHWNPCSESDPSCVPGFLVCAIIGRSQKLLFNWSVGLKWNLKHTTGNFQNKNLAAAWQLSVVSLHLRCWQGPKALILYSWCSNWKTVRLVHIFEKDTTCKVSFSAKTLQTGVFLSLMLLKSDVLERTSIYF